ncbi:hypothetical protein ACTHGU_03935 [Chitinophagaceae bacterium MMS25-I14]
MITLLDILHKLNFDRWAGAENAGLSNVELLQSHLFSIRAIITTNIEAAEERFYHLYGRGETHYFPLENYEQGKHLAMQLFHHLRLDFPERYSDPELLVVGKKMFLFVFVQKTEQAGKQKIG